MSALLRFVAFLPSSHFAPLLAVLLLPLSRWHSRGVAMADKESVLPFYDVDEDSGSEASSTGTLLPQASQCSSPLKASFHHHHLPQAPSQWAAWALRFLPRSLRRRNTLAAILCLIVIGSVPLFTVVPRLSIQPQRTTVRSSNPAEFIPPLSLNPHFEHPYSTESAQEQEREVTQDTLPLHLQPDTYLEGLEATAHFRDSLRNDTTYITSFLSAGWTNDQITIGNLIYLAKITGRIPILPPFTSYIDASATPLPFSEIFDVPRMAVALDLPILEWGMVKDLDRARNENVQDNIGCWNIWEVDNLVTDPSSGGPRSSYTTVLLNLDISYTRAPQYVKLIPNYEHDRHSTFWSLAKLAFPDGRAEALANPETNPTRPSESNKVILPPDEQLLCYDYLYYVCALDPFEFERDYSPMWRDVMLHAHWTRDTVELAEGYLRQTLHLAPSAPIPPFIAIHARRGDFLGWCGDVPKDDCFAPLSAFAQRVREVQDEVRTRLGVYVSHVVMTGDEKDVLWWEAVQERGWLRVDHKGLGTAEAHGNWYPVVLDAVIQSMSVGFVGTDRSTFSHMARRRVADWNGGATRLVKWGHVGADQH